tara:strand:+ start:1975 stop:2205 length:231 start_codon:yes stop_codon:yes gene_type:complete
MKDIYTGKYTFNHEGEKCESLEIHFLEMFSQKNKFTDKSIIGEAKEYMSANDLDMIKGLRFDIFKNGQKFKTIKVI